MASCSNSGQGNNNQLQGEVDSLKNVIAEMKQVKEHHTVETLKPKNIEHVDQLVGLFTGRFEEYPEVVRMKKDVKQFMDSLNEIDEFWMEEYVVHEYYDKLKAEERKFMYLDPLYGVYAFRNPNAVSILIEGVEGDSIYGKSICAGNERPVSGTILPTEEGVYKILLKEPGDDQYDGSFIADFYLEGDSMTGGFSSYKDDLDAKGFVLKSAEFVYKKDADEWDLDNMYFGKSISKDSLTIEDVENQPRHRLRILRNLIFARHGYSFKKKDVRDYFESHSWYVPISTDVRNELTAVEEYNIGLIKRYETYAEDYYDEFGR